MARSRKKEPKTLDESVTDYRHKDETRKNVPPAKIAAEGVVPVVPKQKYAYSPRRPPELQFDPNGLPDAIPELIAKAQREPLTEDEAKVLSEALRTHQPWLEWAQKREQHDRGYFEVDPVALIVHERVSAQAILKIAARQDAQRDLFADPQQEYHEAVQFYQHDIAWANRLILGDSLQVMASLAQREDLAGKVQMIYIDPPYGIKFASNFQPEIGRRDVKDKESDLTREPEMVKAYRDTWHLGVHSYLTYLWDRITVARDLLADSGSIFVQIGDENAHRVRSCMDEIFGSDNLVSEICVSKTSGLGTALLSGVVDYILWYAKDINKVKFRQLYRLKKYGEEGAREYTAVEMPSGERRTLTLSEKGDENLVPHEGRVYRLDNLTSQSRSNTTIFEYSWEGKTLGPGAGGWKTNLEGMNRLAGAHRIKTRQIGDTICYVRYLKDFPAIPINNMWTDVSSGFNVYQPKLYAVQTNERIIERCLLLATNPGDLVLDPTCGAGTTAEVAEQWGRRWITIDTSRVAISIARQRLLTSKYEYYKTRPNNGNPNGNPGRGFQYKSVPHIMLKSVARNANLDPIFEKYEPILDEKLAACSAALADVKDDLRKKLSEKVLIKQKDEGKRSINDADERLWKLPKSDGGFQHWTVPFDTDPDWPKALQDAVTEYRAAWRAKMDEVNACIEANADEEELVDQPEVVKGITRVSGPFTVESVQPPEMTLGEDLWEGKFDGDPDELDETFDEPRTLRRVETQTDHEAQNLHAYLDRMLKLLRMDGVQFPDNKKMVFSRLELLAGSSSGIHAEGRWHSEGEEDADPEGAAKVCVAFGPQYGPVTAKQVEELIKPAGRAYDALVIAGFSFDGPSQTVLNEDSLHPKLTVHAAHIRPDINPGMDGLLKDQPNQQLFSVFGQPRSAVHGPNEEGEYTVAMEGVDIYDPVRNEIQSTGASKVAAWFLDGDYDGRTFCITQAFFPDKDAWKKLARALKGVVDEDAFAAFSGTESLPFPLGEHKRVAIKVIDPRGNEVMSVHEIESRRA